MTSDSRAPTIALFLGIGPLVLVGLVGDETSAAVYTARLLDPVGAEESGVLGFSENSQVGLFDFDFLSHTTRAVLWHGTADSAIDLHPDGFAQSIANDVSGTTIVGNGYLENFNAHALLWQGSADNVVDLHPMGYKQSAAGAVSGPYQVGWGELPSGQGRALLWHGSADSVVDLNPPGFVSSSAHDISGTTVIGDGYGPSTGNYFHALIWNGFSPTATDIHPVGYIESLGLGISGTAVVGIGVTHYTEIGIPIAHSVLWDVATSNFVDLHPPEFRESRGFAVSGNFQVGTGSGTVTNDEIHALVWNGTAASVVDLHSSLTGLGLPFTSSFASDVNSNGDVVGNASVDGRSYAVIWFRVPEPTCHLLVGIAAASSAAFRWRCKRNGLSASSRSVSLEAL